LAAQAALAQVDWGTISLTVTDSTGGRLANVHVKATGKGTGLTREATTDERGECVLTPLQAGTYDVEASTPTFSKLVQHDIALAVQATVHLDFVMNLGDVQQTVDVKGDVPLLEAETSTVGQVIGQRQVDMLPLNGRNFVQLAYTVPGVNEGQSGNVNSGERPDNRRNNGSISAAGARFNSNNVMLDGVDDNETNQNNVVSLPDIDAIQEFKVLTGIYPAEYGRNYGAQVVVITKAGTNQFHGDAWEFFRNDKLDAKNFFAPAGPNPAFRQNQFGFTAGGPIVKDHTWFFADYQGYRERQALPFVSTVPPASLRQSLAAGAGVFFDPAYFGSKPVIDPLSGSPFPNNTIPFSRVDPVMAKILQGYPLPTNSSLGGNFVYNGNSIADRDQFSLRIDQKLSDKGTLYGRFSFGNSLNDYPGAIPPQTVGDVTFGSIGGSPFPGPETGNDRSASITEIQVFSPSKVNVIRAGFTRWDLNLLALNTNRGPIAQKLGIPGVNIGNTQTDGLPQFGISGYATLGDENAVPLLLASNTYQINDAFSYIRGHHAFKFGADFERLDTNIGQILFPRGNFSFSGIFTGNSLGDALLGVAASASRTWAAGIPGLQRWGYAGFAEDTWRVSSHLTLELGLRWETFTAYTERHDRLSNFDFRNDRLLVAGVNASRTANVRSDLNNFAPRFGYAYQINSKLVARGGFGVFYNLSDPTGAFNRIANNPPLLLQQTQTASTYQQAPRASAGFVVPAQPFPASGPNFAYQSEPLDNATPYVLEYSTGLEYQMSSNLVLKATYVGNVGRKIPASLNANQAAPAFGPIASLPLNARRPLPDVSDVTYNANMGRSSFNALETSLEKRYASGLDFLFSYTWAHTIDLSCSYGGTPNCATAPPNPYDLNSQRGNSEVDQRHRFTATWRYELPFGRGKSFLNAGSGLRQQIVGGWSIGGITTIASGLPFDVRMSRSTTGNGVNPRPDLNPNLGACPAWRQTVNSWFNPCMFVAPPNGVFGNFGRLVLRNPGRNNWDVSVFKEFPISEQRRLEFRSEFFNLFNHPNFEGPPNTAVSGDPANPLPGQGALTAAYPARQIQFALKFYW
jgi:hypothetical protein